MPSVILSPIKITSVTGTVNFGDVLQLAPKTISKSYSGSASNNTGDIMQSNSFISNTNTSDPDIVDSAQLLNR